MKSEKLIECERNRLNKILKFRLPNHYKLIGIIVFSVSFILMFVRIWFPEQNEALREITRKGLVVGMLLVSLARDKEEDELTTLLRAQSYAVAFIVGVLYALVMPYVEYGVSNVVNSGGEEYKDLGDFQLLIFMLMIQLMFYHTLKRYR